MDSTQVLLREVVAKQSKLALHGILTSDYEKLAGNSFESDRREILNRVKEFGYCLKFFNQIERLSQYNYNFNTRDIKHFAERHFRERGLSIYIPEGVLIAAAYATGFKVHRRGESFFFNVKLGFNKSGIGICSGKSVLLNS